MRRVLLIAVIAAAFAGLAGADHHQGTKAGEHEGMMMGCEAYMQQKQAADAQMKEMDSRLTALVAKMNGATGQARVDAMAAVITELVTQRSAMRDQMMKMGPMMMHEAGCPMHKAGAAAPETPHSH